MYAYLKGTIESVAEGSVVLDVGGVGYQLTLYPVFLLWVKSANFSLIFTLKKTK